MKNTCAHYRCDLTANILFPLTLLNTRWKNLGNSHNGLNKSLAKRKETHTYQREMELKTFRSKHFFFLPRVFVEEEVMLAIAHNISTEIIKGNLLQNDGTYHLLSHRAFRDVVPGGDTLRSHLTALLSPGSLLPQ